MVGFYSSSSSSSSFGCEKVGKLISDKVLHHKYVIGIKYIQWKKVLIFAILSVQLSYMYKLLLFAKILCEVKVNRRREGKY